MLLIAGSPSEHSRSAALLDAVSQRLGLSHALIERLAADLAWEPSSHCHDPMQ